MNTILFKELKLINAPFFYLYSGSEGTLDLTKKASIPKKLANEIRTLKETYGLNLRIY